jgi:hypothetical protein
MIGLRKKGTENIESSVLAIRHDDNEDITQKPASNAKCFLNIEYSSLYLRQKLQY